MLVQQTKLDNVTGLAACASRRISPTLFLFLLSGAFTRLISLATVPALDLGAKRRRSPRSIIGNEVRHDETVTRGEQFMSTQKQLSEGVD
jgi:hypothetical protein